MFLIKFKFYNNSNKREYVSIQFQQYYNRLESGQCFLADLLFAATASLKLCFAPDLRFLTGSLCLTTPPSSSSPSQFPRSSCTVSLCPLRGLPCIPGLLPLNLNNRLDFAVDWTGINPIFFLFGTERA